MTHHLTQRRQAAVRHVLTSPSIAARTAPHLLDDEIDWAGLLDDLATMSGGERYLVDIARRLWSGDPVPPYYELTGQLDAVNTERVIEAVAQLGESHPIAA